jgi:hypothetical protein
VNEHVLSAICWRDEAVSLVVSKEFNRSGQHAENFQRNEPH